MSEQPEQLNENDKRLLSLCFKEKHTITELSKLLDIAPKNISVRVKELKKKGFVSTEIMGKGRPTYVKSNTLNLEDAEKMVEGYKEILKDILNFIDNKTIDHSKLVKYIYDKHGVKGDTALFLGLIESQIGYAIIHKK